MTIYHGSNTPVKNPRILISNRLLDFGEGFYSTSSLEQAKKKGMVVILRLLL